MVSYIIVHGPLWDGEANAAVERWLAVTRERVAAEGVLMLKAFPMDKTGRARGGFQANVARVTRSDWQVIPGPKIPGVTWSPWLEGTSRRNDTTRFKGYHLFRRTRILLARNWRRDAQAELLRYLAAMGGHSG
jgi:hypothetical protein